MSASDEGHNIAKEYLDFKQKEVDKSIDIEVTFGDLLFEMGEWLKSRTYFENLVQHRSNDPQVHYGIGHSCYAFGELHQALFHFEQAYVLSMQDENQCLALAAKICSNTLLVLQDCGILTEALDYGNEALELYRRAGEHGNESGIAKLLTNIGVVLFQKGNDAASLDYFQRALQLLQSIHIFDSPEISDCYSRLSLVDYHKGDHEKALDYLLKKSQIEARLFPANHPNIAATENNIGKQYYKQGKYKEALQRFLQAANIQDQTSTNCNDVHTVILNNIGKALYRLNSLDEANKYYEQALQMITKIFSSSSSDSFYLPYTLKNKGEILFAQGNFAGALELFERAHNVYERIFALDGDHRDIAKCKHLIGLTHLALNDLEKSADAIDKALRMWTKVLPGDHPDLALGHRSMGELYMRKNNGEANASRHFKMALSIYEKRLPDDHEQLRDLKNKLAVLDRRQV